MSFLKVSKIWYYLGSVGAKDAYTSKKQNIENSLSLGVLSQSPYFSTRQFWELQGWTCPSK